MSFESEFNAIVAAESNGTISYSDYLLALGSIKRKYPNGFGKDATVNNNPSQNYDLDRFLDYDTGLYNSVKNNVNSADYLALFNWNTNPDRAPISALKTASVSSQSSVIPYMIMAAAAVVVYKVVTK